MSVEEKRISLKEIVNEAFNLKYTLSILFLFMALAVFFIFNINKPRWTATLKVEELNTIDHIEFLALKNYDEIYSVKRDYLAELFIEEIKGRSGATEIIDRLGIIDRSQIKNEKDYFYEVKKEAYQIEIYREKEGEVDELLPNEIPKEYYVIEYSGYNYDSIIQIISFICDNANKKVKEFLISKYTSTVDALELDRMNQIQDIDKAIENSLADLKKKNDKKVAFLREQSEIAKSLEIAENQLKSEAIELGEDIKPYYLRGYVAIDKEIELIKSRSDVSLFSDENEEILFEKRILEQDLTSNRFSTSFDKTPISKDHFKAASYDIANIQISRSDFGRLKILIIGLFAGIILSCITVVFSIYLRKGY